LLGALAKLPGPGSELRRPILVAWGQDRCLGGVLPCRAASKQARTAGVTVAVGVFGGASNLSRRWPSSTAESSASSSSSSAAAGDYTALGGSGVLDLRFLCALFPSTRKEISLFAF